jgi:hypothetical protein
VSLQAYAERLDYVLKILPLPLAYATNGDQQFWKQKFHAANEEAQHALMNNPVFFLFEGGYRDFFVFFTCSQCVPKFPNVFPKMFPIGPGFYPTWFAQISAPLCMN